MLKKLLKGCLTIAMVGAMAMPVMAADISASLGGRVRAEFTQTSIVDGASYMDMASDHRLGANLKAEEGDWTMSARAMTDTGALLESWVGVANDAVSIKFGRQWWGLWSQTGAAFQKTVDRLGYGTAIVDYRTDRLIVGLKSMPLNILYETNKESGPNTGLDVNQSGLAVSFAMPMDALSLYFAYAMKTYAADEKLAAGAVDSADDGWSNSGLTVSVKYAISETMAAEFDFQSETQQDGGPNAPDPTATTQMGFCVDVGLGDGAFLSAAYDMRNSAQGDAKSDTANLAVNYMTPVAGAKVFAGYLSQATATDDGAGTTTDIGKSVIAAGMRVNY